MLVEPRVIVDRLNPTCTRMLEDAVGSAASGQFYEITSDHMLAKILEREDGDAQLILQHFGVDRLSLLRDVSKAINLLRVGNSGRPVFSETLFQWFEDAWVVASLRYGAKTLRSGHLLSQFINRGTRYSGSDFDVLETVSVETLNREFQEIVEPSHETEAEHPASGHRPTGEGTAALEKFTHSFTEAAREGKIDPIIGRHQEIRQLVDILARRRKNNPIIVGEPGVGKTALVEGLARAIVEQDVPDLLKNVELVSLDMGQLQAGASVKGEFEKRLKAVIEGITASPTPIVLFIDEAHTLIGAGGQGGNDAANLLKPALARGELRTIAATTWAEYKKYFEKDAALERRFQPVQVDEPSEDVAISMLRGIAPIYESAHRVTIREDALIAAVSLSHRYISGRQLPDKAVDLLDTAAARVKIEQAAKPDVLIALEEERVNLSREHERLLRDDSDGVKIDLEQRDTIEQRLEELIKECATLEDRWEREREAIRALLEARANLRTAKASSEPDDDGTSLQSAIERVESARATHLDLVGSREPLVHAEVDASIIARVVSTWTGIPVGRMRSSMVDAVLSLETNLESRIRGQRHALAAVSETMRTAFAGIRNPNTPLGVLLFVGPSGVGKTETALALSELLYGGERFLTSINMSEFQEKHTVSRLVGSPPGYVGYGEGGVLTEAIRQRPYSVVLLDECEKADPDVMNIFYQVFDKGVLNDGEGRAIDFKNTIIILTSNLASEKIMNLYRDGEPSVDEVIEAVRPTLRAHFKAALLARMTIVPYRPINAEIMAEITRLKLEKLENRLADSHKITTDFSSTVVTSLASRCTDPASGARNVDHVLRKSLMPSLSRALLERLTAGDPPRSLSVSLDNSGGWIFNFV